MARIELDIKSTVPEWMTDDLQFADLKELRGQIVEIDRCEPYTRTEMETGDTSERVWMRLRTIDDHGLEGPWCYVNSGGCAVMSTVPKIKEAVDAGDSVVVRVLVLTARKTGHDYVAFGKATIPVSTGSKGKK